MRDFSRGFLSYCDDALNGAPTRAGKNASHGRDGGYRSDLRRYGPEGDGAVRGGLPARPTHNLGWPHTSSRLSASSCGSLTDPHRGATRGAHVAKTLNIEGMPQVARGDWAACLGTEAVEGFQNWHTYTVADCPRQLTDIWGSAVDYGQAIREEIKLQTGVEPVDVHESQETRRGLRPAYRDDDCVIQGGYTEEMATLRHRPISATDHQEPPTYPMYHSRFICDQKPACRRCGGKDHHGDDCDRPERCANCFGPFQEDHKQCPARPRRSHGQLVRLSKIEKHAVRKMGSRLYRQTNMELERLAPTTSPQAVEARQMQRPPPSSAQAPDPTALLPPQDEIVVATYSPESLKKRLPETKNPRQEDYPSSPGQRGKAEPYHSMALRLAEAEDYDITFHAFAPERAWDPDQAPRVMSYARNDANIRVEQICSIPTRDILWLRVNGILIINFYRHEGTPEPLD
ncbi:Endonuclease/exonuclease/phosphatase [Hirsutella rhossiliensis]|uniref:Endonuclease/exonuclease/phosphatase n=1 Tax=Hirsutella rhossiliensis TaxID=111463 RepID=A0A9P8MVQ7_9HYPO|nr:Endonuclease/exonuclease/phosphatase [Hirsutella rhossiliensis]KAH0961289.1 Endonuclease/exonuclease/phosphatase [Hirsutella rhossiliensis]